MEDILDPSWIANILSISFTLVVFLLGLPLVFIQTFVPEELRTYYRQVQSTDRKDVKVTAILLLIVILFFGNHGFNYILHTEVPDEHLFMLQDGWSILFTRKVIIVFYYLISLGFFLFLSWKIYKIFHKGIFRGSSFKKEIIELVFRKIKTNYQNSGNLGNRLQLADADIVELIELGEIFNKGIERKVYDKHLFDLISYIVREQNYSGEETKVVFEEILSPYFLAKAGEIDYQSLSQVLDVCKLIAKRYQGQTTFKSYDSEAITHNFLSELCLKFIALEKMNLANSALRILRLFHTQQEIYFRIFYSAFEKKNYTMVTLEIKQITQFLLASTPDSTIENSMLYNLIAYLSLFNSGNPVMKNYAFQASKRLGNIINLNIAMAAKRDFVRNGKFETADKISNAIREFYGLSKPHILQ